MATLHPVVFLTAVSLIASTGAQTGWTLGQPVNRPSARAFHAMALDLGRGTTVMFGGAGPSVMFADTWEWNGMTWTRRTTANSPPARASAAMAHDILRGRIVLFGGSDAVANADLNDTWEYDGIDWTQRPTAIQPSPRRVARMAYAASNARMVLFGGGSFVPATGVAVVADTWEWDGSNWTSSSPASAPAARWGHGMAYDFVRAKVVLFGGETGMGTVFDDTWTWDGTGWTPHATTPSPPANRMAPLCYDVSRSLVVHFGGQFNVAETWLWDGASWRRDPRALTPPLRNYSALAHDLQRGRSVLFGGLGTTHLNDTWEYDPGLVAQWTPFGSGCAGTVPAPTLRSLGASLPILGSSFAIELAGVPAAVAAISIGFSNQLWNGNALPWSLAGWGMSGCLLFASPDFMFLRPVFAGHATLSWPLPNDASLAGVRFFNQAFVLDPGGNPLGAIVSNAGAGTIGPF